MDKGWVFPCVGVPVRHRNPISLYDRMPRDQRFVSGKWLTSSSRRRTGPPASAPGTPQTPSVRPPSGSRGGAEKAGRRTMFSLNPRVVQPMGESQYPGVARPLLFSPMKGRDARAGVSLYLRNPVLSLTGGRRSSSGERQRESCDAELDFRDFARSKTPRVQPRDLRSSVSKWPISDPTSTNDSALWLHVSQSAPNRRF